MAFSDTVTDPDTPGVEYTETGMNVDAKGQRIKEKELPERFGTDEYQVLIVAEKYQTGFDQASRRYSGRANALAAQPHGSR